MVDKTKQGSNKGNPVAKHMRTFNKATVQRDRKKDDKRGYSKHSKTYESAEEFVPHDMFHPKTGETKRADSKATHLVLKARGWTHSKNESVVQVDEADRGSSSKHPPVKVGDKFTHANHTRVVTKVTPDGINATRTNGTERTAHDHGYVQKQMVESVDNAKAEKDSARMKLRHANQKVRLAKKQERENDRVSEDAGDPNSSAKKPVKFKKPDGTTGVKMVPAHQDVQTEACWDSHKQVGTKKKGGKTVPNCVPKESSKLSELSNDKVHNYLSKSMHQSDDAKSRGDSKLRAKREKGIKLGLKKQTGTAKVASTESYQQVLEASSNYLSKDDLPAKVKRVVINIFKLAKSKKKKIVRLSVELVGKKYYVYVELGRDNNDEDFVGRIMDMETGREKFLEIHPSASVHPAPNVSIREAVQQVDEAKKVASVKSTDRNGNTHFLHHHDNGVVSANNDKKSGIGLGNLAPFHRGGTADRKKAVHTIAKSAKNSKDLASKLNKSGLGRSNWEVNEEIEEAYFSVQFRDEKGKADSSSKNFKSASAAKKYADNANKTTKVGSYTTNKVQGRMESVEQVEEGRKLVLNINPKWSMKEVNREIKDTTQEIKQGQADHKRRPMNPTQADQHWQRKHYLEKLVALRKKKKSLGEETMSDSISGNWGKVNEALSDVVVKKMQDMVGGPKNMPRGPEFRALKAKAQAAVAAEKKAKKAAPKAKTTTKTAKGKTHKGSSDPTDRNIIMSLRIAQDSMNHGDKTNDIRVSPTRTVKLSKGKIDALLKKHDALQKPVDKRKFTVLMTKALRGMK